MTSLTRNEWTSLALVLIIAVVATGILILFFGAD